MHCSKTLSFNNLVRQCEHRWRHSDAKRSGGLEIDDKLIFCRLLHRQLGGVCALDGSPAICRASSSGSFRSTAFSHGRMRLLPDYPPCILSQRLESLGASGNWWSEWSLDDR